MQSIISNSDILYALHKLSKDKREEVIDFVNFLQTRPSEKRNITHKSLKGIWKNEGFQNITNLEAVIEEARTTLGHSILERAL
jgi:hypothetical protein